MPSASSKRRLAAVAASKVGYKSTQEMRDALVKGQEEARVGGGQPRDAEARAEMLQRWFDAYTELDDIDKAVLSKNSITAARIRGVFDTATADGLPSYGECSRELNQMTRAMTEVNY